MKLSDTYYSAIGMAAFWASDVGSALAQSSGDPSAPLDILKTARQKASNSALNADSIATGGNKAGIVLTVLFAVAGIACAGYSAVTLYKSASDENARHDSGRSIAGIIIGSSLTILGVVIGVVTQYMTGS